MKFREATKSGFRQKDLEHEKKESCVLTRGASQVVPVIKNLPAHAGDMRHGFQSLGREGSPGGGDGYPLQYSCLKNLVDR